MTLLFLTALQSLVFFDNLLTCPSLDDSSSGSSVFKARDRWENHNTVAIKKIPLATLTDSFSLTKDYEVPQEEIDYFVSWIVDHYGDRNESFVNPTQEESDFAFNDNDSDSDSSSINQGSTENPRVQRRPSFNKETTRGLSQVVKSLGCLRNDTELWIALELCAGGSVADLIRLSDGPMMESEIGWIMGQILLGLAYLHSKDHVHGDIKASNILLTLDGHVKLGGSGAIMSHKEGAGERKRRRRSLTMSEFPATDGVSPDAKLSGWCLPSEALEAVGMGMSKEMWMFIRKCLTPDPEARPSVQDLLQDPFIVQHDKLSQELLLRIGSMVDFVSQCASISEGQTLDSAGSDNDLYSIATIPGSASSPSVTLSPSKASHMIDFKMDEADWFIPRIRPRVDSVYDESSFFDEAGVQRPIAPLDSVGPLESGSSLLPAMDWKHQRMSHPKVMQALMCDQPRYLTFRHSRSPSLATIVEDQMEEDALYWSDDEGSSDDDTNAEGHDNDVISTSPFQQQYSQQCMYDFFQESQSQNQQQPWTPKHDKRGMEAVAHATSQDAHGAYLDSLSIEPGCGLRSIVEYDFQGASSGLVVLYEICESWLQ
ncbi:hypothetical protein BG015_011801 [Linnemannia schmuckeri]|uniref:Protein kinase domain-containing protein n=1 Tax=Linnemannia schmuckeri TaxID=64567 RepID=A0A9P5S4R4_9FUNG|nr:hypothetical protein BG015_011801 [Linnemannia schmuckeri]